ncbi:MAG: transposase [Hormoscilla sp. GM7CHS1pb]|nr:transposase [Hormoscilla sp. GM7CHS1pb]
MQFKCATAYPVIDYLSWRAKNLYNLANYHIRQEFFVSGNYIGFFDLYHLLKATDAYLELPTKVSKQIVKRVAKTWKGYFNAHRDWIKHPEKYLGEPKIPGYLDKEKGRYLLVYPLDAISRPGLRKGLIKPSMTAMYISTQVGDKKVCEVRFVPKQDSYVMEVVYEVEERPTKESTGVVAGLDLGLNNLCTLAINIGYNDQCKQGIAIGKCNNQQFVQIPHRQLIDQIKYKGALVGISVVEIEESYTSKCSALDLEPILKHKYYIGRRVKRGLFRTAKGWLINADWNGAVNMIRKVFSNEYISELIEAQPLRPRVVNPI